MPRASSGPRRRKVAEMASGRRRAPRLKRRAAKPRLSWWCRPREGWLLSQAHDLPHLHQVLKSAEAPPESLDPGFSVALTAEKTAEFGDPPHGGWGVGGLWRDDGRGKLDRYKLRDKPVKDIWLYPLDRRFRSVLTASRLPTGGAGHPR